MSEGRLPVKVKIGYGIGDIGGNLWFTTINFWLLNYLTDTVGLAAGLAGLVIAVGKVWDAGVDPVAGYLSDKTVSRWGRRRPWIFFGAFPLFIFMIIMFTNPKLGSQTALFIWGAIVFCLLGTSLSAVNIPYNSLTPELTQDFHERTTLNGYRFAFAVVGTLLGAGASLPLVNAFPNRDIGFTALGAIFGAIMLITSLITFFTVKESAADRPLPTEGFFQTYLRVFKNRPYVLIFLVYAIHVTALGVVMGVAVYYFKYIHHDEAKTTVAMLILLVTAMIFIPLSVVEAKRFGKKPVYGSGLLVLAASLMILFFYGHVYGINFSFFMMFVMGIGLANTMALPYAMVPDAVEYDYLLTGERREGAFYGLWTFGTKVGQAIALAISGFVLDATGYVPEAVQTDLAKLGIRLLVGPISAAIFILAVVVLYFYPLNEQRYNEILEQIKQREARKAG
ncbi:MAG: glycoside-pentoside-hexuronide (GPH):cation symporter [Thermodesulfobacteriota bacterium]